MKAVFSCFSSFWETSVRSRFRLSKSRNRSYRSVNYFLFSDLTATTNSQQWLLFRFLSFAGSKLFFFYAYLAKEGFQWRLVSLCLQCLILKRSKLSTIQDKLVVTIAQDVKTEKSSRTSKSESFGLNLGFQNSGIPSFGVNYQKVKINEQRQESHHQVNIAINIPSDCDEGCKKHADKVFQLANNALYYWDTCGSPVI